MLIFLLLLVLQAVKLPWYVTVLLWQLYNHCKARRVTVRWSSKITEVAEQTIRHYILHPAQLTIFSDQSPDSHLINVDFRQSQKQKLSPFHAFISKQSLRLEKNLPHGSFYLVATLVKRNGGLELILPLTKILYRSRQY